MLPVVSFGCQRSEVKHLPVLAAVRAAGDKVSVSRRAVSEMPGWRSDSSLWRGRLCCSADCVPAWWLCWWWCRRPAIAQRSNLRPTRPHPGLVAWPAGSGPTQASRLYRRRRADITPITQITQITQPAGCEH